MTSTSSIPLSSMLRVLSQNVNGLQTKLTMRKRKQTRIVALGSLLRSLEVDFFAIQEPHFVTAEDRQAGTRCLSKYEYGLDGPLHEEGRGGVALAWKTSKWTLQLMKFLSPRALKASMSSGPLEITLVVVHFHHKHTRHQLQWNDIAKELHGPVAEELPGVMPPGRTRKEQGPRQQRHGPYTQIQPAPKKVKPQQERQRFKVQALSQLDAIANEGPRAVDAELTTMAWARNQQIWLRVDQLHSTRMHCEIVDSHGEPWLMSNQELYSVMV